MSPGKYLICRGNDYLVDRKQANAYPISYPLVIAHAFWSYTQEHNLTKAYAKDAAIGQLSEFARMSIEQGITFQEPSLFEIFHFEIKDVKSLPTMSGQLFVDRSKGCFPLVLYPIEYAKKYGDEDDKKRDRQVAFKNSLISIRDKSRDISNLFEQYNTLQKWETDLSLQDKIADLLRSTKN